MTSCSPSVQDITDVNAYVHLLKTNSSLALCDLTMKNFVVQDFSIDNKQLKVVAFMHACLSLVHACFPEPSIQICIKMW